MTIAGDPHRHLLHRPLLARRRPHRPGRRLDVSRRIDRGGPPARVRGQHAPIRLRGAREPAVSSGCDLVDPARVARRAAPELRSAVARLLSLRPLPEGLLKLADLGGRGGRALRDSQPRQDAPPAVQGLGGQAEQGEVPSVEQQAAIGQAVFDHLVNTLGALTQDLQPDVILLLPPIRCGAPSSGPSPPAARVASTPSSPGRRISTSAWGSRSPRLHADADRQAGAVAPRRADHRGQRPCGSPGLHGPRPVDLGRGLAGSAPGAEQRSDRLAPASAFRDLALELAFRIMSAEPALASVGMTRSWDAFDRFRQGLEYWQRYAVQSGEQDPDALTQAIRSFRAAAGVDPAFALAHYRLGLALQKDGQPIAAAEALGTSLNNNPGFLPARVALASVLYSLESRSLAKGCGCRYTRFADPVRRARPRSGATRRARNRRFAEKIRRVVCKTSMSAEPAVPLRVRTWDVGARRSAPLRLISASCAAAIPSARSLAGRSADSSSRVRPGAAVARRHLEASPVGCRHDGCKQ